MEEKNKKRQIAKISVFITSIFVIFMSVTYAFISQTLTGIKEVVINAGVLDLVLEEENAITIANALPMYDEVGMRQDDVFVFRLVNKTSNPTNYILKLSKINADNELSPSDVKYYLTKEGIGEPKLLSSLPTDGTVDSGTIAGGDTIDYTLRLWINSAVTDETAISGKTLSYKIDAEATQEIVKVSFTDELENKVDTTTINFGAISSATNGRGIYKYQEDGEDIYYWRGAVADNHVIFGGYCWEMVRTTKTGGVKIIYDGTPVESNGVQTCPNTGSNSQLSVGNIKFNSSSSDNAYVGYMYGLTGVTTEPASPQCIKKNSAGTAAEVGTETTEETCEQAGGKWATTAYESTHANVVNSNIKGEIDKWFSTSSLNTEENLEKIEDAVYCNDRSIDPTGGAANGYTGYTTLGYGTNPTVYNAAARVGQKITNPQPSLECANVNDRFTTSKENGNGDLTYPVGLLTADEIVLAGGLYGSNNTDYYLNVGSSNYYWALSPNNFPDFAASEFSVNSNNGDLKSNRVNYTCGVRPVVSLAAGTEITGLGTANSPFEVK